MKKIKPKWYYRHSHELWWQVLMAIGIITLIILGIVGSALLVKLIIESDMPTWLKVFLLRR
jgi:hypothetical protein